MLIQVAIQSLIKKLKVQPRNLPFPKEQRSKFTRKDKSGFILIMFLVITVVFSILYSNV